MPYANTKYLWLEKDVEKLQKKIEKQTDVEKITFNENEFKDLVSPLIKNEILSCLNPYNEKSQVLETKLNDLKQIIDSFINNNNLNTSLPVWVPITISVLSTSLFFILIILFSFLFKS